MAGNVTITARLAGFDKVHSELNKTNSELKESGASAGGASQGWSSLKVGVFAATAAFAAAGAAIIKATRAAAEEAAAQERMNAVLANAGVNIKSVDGELSKFFATMQEFTAFNDTAVQNAFTDLIGITGDYKNSLGLTQVAADLARAKNIDLSAAAMLVGRAFEGQTEMLTRYGIVLEKGASGMEAINAIQEKFGGTAQKTGQTAGFAFERISNAVDDIIEAFGIQFLGGLNKVADGFTFVAKYAGLVFAAFRASANISMILVAVFSGAGGLIAVIRNAGEIMEAVSNIAGGFGDVMAAVGRAIYKAVTGDIAGAFSGFTQEATEGFGRVKTGAVSLKNVVVSEVSGAFNSVKESIKSVGDAYEEAQEKIGSKPLLPPDITGGEGAQGADLSSTFEEIKKLQEESDAFRIAFGGAYEEIAEKADEASVSVFDNWANGLEAMRENLGLFGELAATTFDMFATGAGDAFAQAIVYGEDLGAAFKKMMQDIAVSIIATLLKVTIQRIIAATIGKAIDKLFGLSSISTSTGIAAAGAAAQTFATVPPPFSFALAPANAAAAAAMTGGLGASLAGAAAGGIEDIPDTGTFLLHRGERVLQREANQDLTDFLSRGGAGGGVVVNMPVTISGPAIFDAVNESEFSARVASMVAEQVRRQV